MEKKYTLDEICNHIEKKLIRKTRLIDRKMYSLKEISLNYPIGHSTLRRELAHGNLIANKVAGKYWINIDYFESWLNNNLGENK